MLALVNDPPGIRLTLRQVRLAFAQGGTASIERTNAVGPSLRSKAALRVPSPVLDGMDLTVEPGAFVALLGPSGCGKSTLLRLAAGLLQPSAGTIERDGGALAFVFQDAHLLPWRTVAGNVMLPLELQDMAPSARKARADEALALVGLSDAAARLPAELSGGMRMRVSLARAMVTRPRLLLLDEPFAALDELNRQRLDDALRALWQNARMTVLFVTHAVAEAAYLAERAIVLSQRPARIVLDVALELPAQRSVELRTEPVFQAAVRGLRAALVQGAG